MTICKIALVGYPAEYFFPFAQALSEANFEVYWVCALQADVQHLLRHKVPASSILNINQGFQPGRRPLNQCRQELAGFENANDPKINDIILMDRLISQKDWPFSIEYLHHVALSIADFIISRRISMVSSWRDTAVQLVGMLVCRHLEIPWLVPTRIRIPQEIYGFCTAQHTQSFLQLREPNEEDVHWAESFLQAFENRSVQPALKKASRNFTDVLRLLPSHLRAFSYELRRSFADSGNDFTRYPISRLIFMYLRRRTNLLCYKLCKPGRLQLPPDDTFCLYALHTQPESSIDVQGSYFSDQIGLIRHIARSLPATHLLYVKVHPTDVDGKSLSFYRQIKAIPGVVLVDYSINSRDLLDRAALIFALTGTIAYEAALLQKPVIVFAKNYFNSLPTIHLCTDPTALPALIHILLSTSGDGDHQRGQIIDFLANLRASCFNGEVSRTYGASAPLTISDLDQLKRSYNAVCKVLAIG